MRTEIGKQSQELEYTVVGGKAISIRWSNQRRPPWKEHGAETNLNGVRAPPARRQSKERWQQEQSTAMGGCWGFFDISRATREVIERVRWARPDCVGLCSPQVGGGILELV